MPESDFRELTAAFNRLGGARWSALKGLGIFSWVLVLIILIAALSTSVYSVAPEGKAVVKRFGRVIGVRDPGLHLKLPFGIDKDFFVPTERVLKEEFGFRTARAGRRTVYDTSPEHFEESLMLTGDLNVIDMEWVVQYRIADPVKFLHRVREPIDTIRDVSEAVVRSIVGNRLGSDVLTVGRVEIAAMARTEMQQILDSYELGVAVMTVELQDVTPPDEVKPAFNEVNESRQEKERLINEAEKARNQVIPKARGEADQIIAEAEAYKAERVNKARGEAARFAALVEEYRQAEDTTRRRLYIEMINRVFPKVDRIFIMGESGLSPLPLLDLQRDNAGMRRLEGGQ